MRLILAFILTLTLSQFQPPSIAHAKRIGLVIGNDNYNNLPPHYQLQKARNDARATAQTFQKIGFDILTGFDLNRRQMNIKLSNLADKIEPGDEVMFFFAGHGVRIGGLNYLLPSDIPSIESANESLLKAESLRVNEITDLFRNRGARLSILVLDACRNNPYQDNKSRSIGKTRGLAPMDPPEGTMVLFSAGAGQTALDRLKDNDPNPNSIFTRTFLPLVEQQGLELSRLSRKVKAEVRKLAKSIGHTQTPAIYNEVVGDVYLFGRERPQKQQPKITINKSAEDILWSNIENSKTAADFEFYLSKFPNGKYAAVAELKLQRIQPKLSLLTPPQPKAQKTQTPSEADYQKARNFYDGKNGERTNLKEAKRLFLRAAQKGHPKAMYDLAFMYEQGLAGKKDQAEAIKWYEKAAENDHVSAMVRIGTIYSYGQGIKANKAKAFKWYKKAALNGNPSGMFNYATLLSLGSGVKRNSVRAVKWYQKSADRGHTYAMYSLAINYDAGTGTKKDRPKAAKLIATAIERKNSFVLEKLTEKPNFWSKQFRQELQKILKAKGLYTGNLDGNFGSSSKNALKKLAGK